MGKDLLALLLKDLGHIEPLVGKDREALGDRAKLGRRYCTPRPSAGIKRPECDARGVLEGPEALEVTTNEQVAPRVDHDSVSSGDRVGEPRKALGEGVVINHEGRQDLDHGVPRSTALDNEAPFEGPARNRRGPGSVDDV